jgi:eukaryotic-like serine/threonine-protein kinase
MTIITVSMLLVALPIHTNTIIHQQQQRQAFAQANDNNNNKNKNNNSFRTYENPAYGIQIQYPSTWIVYADDVFSDNDDNNDASIDIVSFLGPVKSNKEAYAPSLYISIDNPPSPSDLNLNLNEYLTRITNDYEAGLKEFKVIESDTNSSILAGKPAYKLVFTDEEDEIYYKTMDIGTIIGDKVYSLSYVAQREQYSDYLPTVQKMINSLKIMTTSNNGLDTEAPSSSA